MKLVNIVQMSCKINLDKERKRIFSKILWDREI